MTAIVQDYKPTTLETGFTNAIALHNDVNVTSLEYLQANRDRFRGVLITNSIASLTSYVASRKEQANTDDLFHGFIDANGMDCTVYFDLLNKINVAGHGDDKAYLKLKHTAAFRELERINGENISQKTASEFIEDWRDYITAYSNDEQINTLQAINSIRNVTIDYKSKQEHSVGDMSQSRSTLDAVEASSSYKLPSHIVFSFVPYPEFPVVNVTLRLSIKTGGDKPILVFRWVGEEVQKEQFVETFKEILTKELKGNASVLIGDFKLNS